MPLKQLDSENADRNLTSQVTVLTHTPNADNPTLCVGLVQLGDGSKNLDGTGGDFELTVSVGGQTVQPDPQVVTFSTAARAAVWTTPFPVPANASVLLKVKSPNAGDSDVDVTAHLYEITYALPVCPAGQNGGLALHDDVTYYGLTAGGIADAVWDETLADHLGSGSTGDALDAAGDGGGGSGPTAGEIADAIWDEALADHLHVGSTGEALDQAGTYGLTVGGIADAVWDEALADHLNAGSTGEALDQAGAYGLTVGGIADAVWSDPDRTLTIPSAATNDAVDAGELICRRGDTYEAEIADLSNLTDFQEVWLTIKEDYDDDDDEALIQVTASGGLTILAGEAATDSTLASITVDEGAGSIAIVLAADVTTALERSPDWTRTPKVYDIQVLTAAGTVVTVAIGTFTVLPDVTRTFAYYGVP